MAVPENPKAILYQTSNDFSKVKHIQELYLNIITPQTSTLAIEALKPLDEVFIDDELKDGIITSVAIPELLTNLQPGHSGAILYGPPGTGKTVLLKAICGVYRNVGAYAEEISAADMNSSYVGQFAKNLEQEIAKAIAEANKRGIHSFLSFDEGSILAEKANDGANSVAKHYQEAIDVLKRYLGNDHRIVMGISTNGLPESFEAALTREGRLAPYFIGYPDLEQRARMWKHFAAKSEVMELTEEQAYKLANSTDARQGAFIEEFCRTYNGVARMSILKERGIPTLVEALKRRAKVSEREVKGHMTFDRMYQDVNRALGNQPEAIPIKRSIGFHP